MLLVHSDITAVDFQTEGFDGFTLELWSQLGGNKRKWVVPLRLIEETQKWGLCLILNCNQIFMIRFQMQGAGSSGETHMWDFEIQKIRLHSCCPTSCDKVNEIILYTAIINVKRKDCHYWCRINVSLFYNYQYGTARDVWQGGVWAVGPCCWWIQPHDVWLLQRCQVRPKARGFA